MKRLFAGFALIVLATCSREPHPLESKVTDYMEQVEALKAAAFFCEERYEAVRDRNQNLEESITDALPEALADVELFRGKVLVDLPPHLQSEIQIQVDRFTRAVALQLDARDKKEKELLSQIEALLEELEKEKQRHQRSLRELELRVKKTGVRKDDEIQDMEEKFNAERRVIKKELERVKARNLELTRRLNDTSQNLKKTIKSIHDFGKKHIHCNECKWRKKKRDVIKFHYDVVKRLLDYQTVTEVRQSQ